MSIYDDAFPEMKPGDERTIVEAGHTFRITATDRTGFHSGRRSYRVVCETCSMEEVHEATTGPMAHVELHIRQVARADAAADGRRHIAELAAAKNGKA